MRFFMTGCGVVVIEAGVVAGYVIAWAVRKARRVGGQLDAEVDTAIDAGLDQLHELVAAKLSAHPALDDLAEEAASDGGQVSELTRQQVELAIAAAARKDDGFGQSATALLTGLREAEQATGRSILAGAPSIVFTGDADTRAGAGGVAFGQVAGAVHVEQHQGPGNPPSPGRSSR